MPKSSSDKTKKAWAILVAAGEGARLRQATGDVAKQFLIWKNSPLYWHSALALARCAAIGGIVFVFPETKLDFEQKRLKDLWRRDNPGVPFRVCAGGASRRDSCRLGLECLPPHLERVLIHDAARPFLRPSLVWRVYNGLDGDYDGIVPGVPVNDTIKMVSRENPGLVEQTPPRKRLIATQTPQGFRTASLLMAHDKGRNLEVTDDATLLELLGARVGVVPGDADNIKITNPVDLALLAREDEGMPMPCSGFGYDAHRFGSGRPLRLGGVAIPGGYELMAHSDGDVLLHALMDAILGCSGLGDIGVHFPDSDTRYAGISSALLLDRVLEMAVAANVTLCNADLTLVAQKPRIQPWREEIRANIARLLKLPRENVNFKATTEEGMGFTGAMEGIKAYALVSGIRGSSG